MMRRLLFLLPALAFATLVGFFVLRLDLMGKGRTPDILPSALIGKPAPNFERPAFLDRGQGFKSTDFKGKVTLVNFFASWCMACHAEHPFLSALEGQDITMVGIDYKDTAENGKAFLASKGNPYTTVIDDPDGRIGIDFGVYGMPETYLVDKQGIIRFREPGPLTPEIIRDEFVPLIKDLNQ